jgi:glycosyltransferase involved in cell wall biosynthesis
MLYRIEDLMLRHKPSRVSCVSISDYVARALREFYGLRTTVIYHGLDESKFTPVDESKRREMKKDLSIDDESIVVSWVGRLVPVKDPITFVKSLAYLKRTRPDIERRLCPLIVGDGPLVSAVRHLSETEKIPLRIIPKLKSQELISLYQLSDLYVSSSLGESFGLSLLEAIACGCCPIVTNAGAHLEIVPENYDGLFDTGDYRGLTSQLVALMSDSLSRKNYAARAQEKFLASFTLKTMTENYLRMYNNVA